MMHKFPAILLLCNGFLISDIALAFEVESSTSIDLRLALNTDHFDGQLIEVNVNPELSINFDNNISLIAIGRLRTSTRDGLRIDDLDRNGFSGVSLPIQLSDSVELDLREFYLELPIGDDYLTLGKQQIVWGKADGLKVLDVINPQSFREFILEDFDVSRIPLWSINYEWQINNDAILQLLWIPDQTMHALPESDSTYGFTSPRIVPTAPPGIAVELNSAKRPTNIIRDSDVGLRWSAFLGGWDLSLNYLYHYDDSPVFFQQLSLTPFGAKVSITPEYKRSHLIGGTFSNAFGDLTVRGELGYSTDKYFLSRDPNDTDGVVKSDELSYVMGFDWFGLSDTLLSFQLFQSIVLDSSIKITRPEVDTTLTLLGERAFLNDTLKAEVILLHNTDDDDGLIRPKIIYEWTDDLTAWVGLDIFYGRKQGLFGQFEDNNRVLVGIDIVL